MGVTSPAGNSLQSVLTAMDQPPSPQPLSFSGRDPLDVMGFTCDLSKTREFLDPVKTRRWGRLQTMSLLAAKRAFLPEVLNGQEAQTGVYVGTGMGSLGETTFFLENMVRQKENFPKPANFVNSVHNATASTLGLEFGLKGENITVVHRDISFDGALGHALSSLQQGKVRYAVVCGADEMNYFHALAGEAADQWKTQETTFKPLGGRHSRATFLGEGAAVCVLSASPIVDKKSWGRILGVKTGRYKRNARAYLDFSHAGDFLEELLFSAGVKAGDVDLVLSGANGDRPLDRVYQGVVVELGKRAARKIPHAAYKRLCGDYRGASGFGFVVAALLLRSGRVSRELLRQGTLPLEGPVKTILLYHLSRSGVHSACLLRRS
jgi:3-oxoacyl-(acyl-carrier-protein) synthase